VLHSQDFGSELQDLMPLNFTELPRNFVRRGGREIRRSFLEHPVLRERDNKIILFNVICDVTASEMHKNVEWGSETIHLKG